MLDSSNQIWPADGSCRMTLITHQRPGSLINVCCLEKGACRTTVGSSRLLCGRHIHVLADLPRPLNHNSRADCSVAESFRRRANLKEKASLPRLYVFEMGNAARGFSGLFEMDEWFGLWGRNLPLISQAFKDPGIQLVKSKPIPPQRDRRQGGSDRTGSPCSSTDCIYWPGNGWRQKLG